MKITLNLAHSRKKKKERKKENSDLDDISLLRLAKSQAFQYAGQAMGNCGTCILSNQ